MCDKERPPQGRPSQGFPSDTQENNGNDVCCQEPLWGTVSDKLDYAFQFVEHANGFDRDFLHGISEKVYRRVKEPTEKQLRWLDVVVRKIAVARHISIFGGL